MNTIREYAGIGFIGIVLGVLAIADRLQARKDRKRQAESPQAARRRYEQQQGERMMERD